MGVREVLAEIEASFISLDDVLRRMSAAEGVTYREAAIALLRWIRETPAPQRPRWMRDSASGAEVDPMGDRFGMRCLTQAALLGEPENDDDIPF